MFLKRQWLFSVLALATISGAVHATAFTIDQHNDGVLPFQGYTTAFGVVGQSFTPTFDQLDHVELQVNSQLVGGTTVHIELMDSPMGTVLGSSNALNFTNYGLPIVLGHFEFTPIDISAYSSLFLNVVADSGTAGVFTAGGLGSNLYSGGAAYLIDAPCCNGFQNDSDLWFRTGLAPVPLPATAWMFGAGLLSLFGAKQRKKIIS